MIKKKFLTISLLASALFTGATHAAECDLVSFNILLTQGSSVVQSSQFTTTCKPMVPLASVHSYGYQKQYETTPMPDTGYFRSVTVGENFNVVPFDEKEFLLSYSVSFIKNPERLEDGGEGQGKLPSGHQWARIAGHSDDVVVPMNGTKTVKFKVAGKPYKLSVKAKAYSMPAGEAAANSGE